MIEWAWSTEVGPLGATDCEAIGSGFLAQPINATTSLAYVATGLTLIVRGLGEKGDNRVSELIYGSTLVAIGFGSVAFHGPQPRGSQFYHDVPISAALLFIFLTNLGRLGRAQRPNRSFVFSIISVAVVSSFAPTLGQIIAAAFAGGAVVTEVIVFRSDQEEKSRRLEAVTVVLLVLAGLGYFFGRSGSAICDPESVWQVHGLWHVLSAAAFMVWGFASSERTRSETLHTEANV